MEQVVALVADNTIQFDDIAPSDALSEKVEQDPYRRFRYHYDQVMRLALGKENAACLATVNAQGAPSARIILVKQASPRGFCFFTHYESRKGTELAQNARAALVFFWPGIGMQVRIEGRASRMAQAESLSYFQSRPRASQIGAWASPQSQMIADRGMLEQSVADVAQRFQSEEKLPLPPFWGGYRIEADAFEFWYSGDARLHDRFSYQRVSAAGGTQLWQWQRLAP